MGIELKRQSAHTGAPVPMALLLCILLSFTSPAPAHADGSEWMEGCPGRFRNLVLDLVPPLRADFPAASGTVPGRRSIGQIGSLRIATYNVGEALRGAGTDPRRFRQAIQVLNSLQADVVVLEEAPLPGELSRLLRENPSLARWKAVGINGNDSHSQIVFLVRRELPFDYTVLSHRRQMWSNPANGHLEPIFNRDAPVLLIRLPDEANPSMIVMGTHNKAQSHSPGDPFSNRKRAAQMETQTRIIDRLQSQHPGVPILQVGDFNADLGRPEIRALQSLAGQASGGMRNAFDVAPEPLPESARVTKIYFPERGNPVAEKLDGIFVDAAHGNLVQDARIHRYRGADGRERPLPATREEQAMEPSDHRPVSVLIDFRRLLEQLSRLGARNSAPRP